MIKVLFGAIIIVFVFFYGYGRRSGRSTVIAEVNGTKITDTLFRSEYQKAYENLARLYQNVYQDQFNEAMIDRFALRERVLNDLIDETLMTQEAEKLSIRLSPQELQAAIHSTPAFQVDGKFNYQTFEAILRANQVTVDEFEEIQRRSQLITKLSDLIGVGAVEVSEREVLDVYTLENEKINLHFIRFNPTDYEKSVSIDDQELEVYFSENSFQFEIPPKVQVQYLVFAPEDYLEAVEVSADEIREEYEYNLDEYRVPKRVQVSHILIAREGEDSEKASEEARKEAEEILDKASKGEDFAVLAEKHSKDPASAKKGGSIGWVNEGSGAPDYVQVAFSLEKGDIGPLVESDDGIHIVKVTDLQEERVKPLDEVAGKIRSEIVRTKSHQAAEDESQEAFFLFFETKNLKRVAAEKGKVIQTTGLFSRNEGLKEVGENLEFNSHAFSQGEVLSPLEIGGKYYIMTVTKREDARIQALEEVQEKVRKEVLGEKSVEAAKAAAEEILKELKAGKSLVKTALARGLTVEETGLFELGNPYVPKVGPTQVFGKEIFSVSKERPLLEKVVSSGKVSFILELKDDQKIDMTKFESEKEKIRKRLYVEKRGQILRQWLDGIRKKSEIKIQDENLGL